MFDQSEEQSFCVRTFVGVFVHLLDNYQGLNQVVGVEFLKP